jgi:hypothetical protein
MQVMFDVKSDNALDPEFGFPAASVDGPVN